MRADLFVEQVEEQRAQESATGRRFFAKEPEPARWVCVIHDVSFPTESGFKRHRTRKHGEGASQVAKAHPEEYEPR